MKQSLSILIISIIVLCIPATASAHVAVTPATVGIGSSKVFTVSSPNESRQPMTSIALTVPAGLTDVYPTALAGWTVTTTKTQAVVTRITWSDGNLLPGQRQDFTFSAQAPAKATRLEWKAYQTFADGSSISWDQKPAGADDASGGHGPFSVSQVVNDLAPVPLAQTGHDNYLALVVAGLALLTSMYVLLFRRRS